MDIARRRSRPWTIRLLPFSAVVVLAAVAAWAVPSLLRSPAAIPAIDRTTIVTDTVRRGPFVRSIRAPGLLAPDRVQVVAAATDGILVEVPVRAGSRVAAGDVVAVLRNPDLDAGVADVRAQLDAAQAGLRSERAAATASRLDAQSALRIAVAEKMRADEEARTDATLHDAGLIGDLAYHAALIKAQENGGVADIDRRKIGVTAAQTDALVASAAAKVAQLRAQLDARCEQVATLVVRAASAGVVQSVAVERGQRAPAGTELARIARAQDLKAVLQVAEGDVHGIAAGLPVTLEASGELAMRGHVARIAPAAQNGTIPVDVVLDAAAPGARPDQNVDGTIEIARMAQTLSIARPPNAADDTRITVYRLSRDGRFALRTPVRLGSGSLERVAIAGGLAAGDTVIVSDTSAYDAPQLRLMP